MTNSTLQCWQPFLNGFYMNCVGAAFSCCVIAVNILIVITVRRTPSLHNASWYIASIAVADMLSAVSFVMFSIFYTIPLNVNEHIYVTRLSQSL